MADDELPSQHNGVRSGDAEAVSGQPGGADRQGCDSVELVTSGDLDELLVLMRAYCDFYRVHPSDQALLSMAAALLADPETEGVQLIARDGRGRPAGFATVFWSWSTASAARVGIMNDLYLVPAARGRGLAGALIAACLERCRLRGAVALEWETAPDNARAQVVYDRIGARQERWLSYSLEVS
ncbi:MAG: N-acetyltransferase family protein [Solirubrobacteraceae bacterium]